MTTTLAGDPRPKHDVGVIGIDRGQLPALDAGPIDFSGWFPGEPSRPVEIEIGSGKGTFLVRRAREQPGVNFIGIEYAREFWRYAADRCRRHNLLNVRLVHAEAESFIRCLVPRGFLQRVHIYFPDPWPKRRHHKRRLIQEAFLRMLHEKLQTGRMIRIATDHGEYFEWIVAHAQRVAELFDPIPFVDDEALDDGRSGGELVGSNFERKYRLEGRRFFTLALRKR